MPIWFHEWLVAPIAFALALQHASRALGARRAWLEMVVLTAYGFALEWMAMAVFSAYRYSPSWAVAPRGVPIAIALMWAAIIVAAMALAARMGAASALQRATAAAALAIALDLLMEPVASRVGLWRWTPAGSWLAVPIGNFVGWAVVVGAYTFGAERSESARTLGQALARRAGLAVAAILLLLLVGGAWRRLGAERLFAEGRGWIAWGALILAPVVLSSRRPVRRSGPSTLSDRLAAPRGSAPLAVFALVALAFIADVACLRDGVLAGIGAATGLSLAVALRPRRALLLE